MAANFLSLPGELRNKIYNHLLVHDKPISPWYEDHELATNLLRANKTIQQEANYLLYSQNCFDLSACNSELIARFLDKIGRKNASYIQSIIIDFPSMRDTEDDVSLEDDSARILARIGSDCTDVRTLITSLDSTSVMEFKFDRVDNPRIVAKALALVDARFRTIPSLQKINVNVYKDSSSTDIRMRMENHGWVINVIEKADDSDGDRFGSDGFDDYDDGFYGHSYEDEYDIDNDSDFWRRMADDD